MNTALRIIAMKLAHKWLKYALRWGVTRTQYYFDGEDIDTLEYDKLIRITVKIIPREETAGMIEEAK